MQQKYQWNSYPKSAFSSNFKPFQRKKIRLFGQKFLVSPGFTEISTVKVHLSKSPPLLYITVHLRMLFWKTHPLVTRRSICLAALSLGLLHDKTLISFYQNSTHFHSFLIISNQLLSWNNLKMLSLRNGYHTRHYFHLSLGIYYRWKMSTSYRELRSGGWQSE